MSILVAAVNHAAVAGNEQRDMRAPGAKRALDTAGPHRCMQGGTNIAKQMWTAALRIKAWGGFPVYPRDVMLLGGKQKSFAERFVPGPQYLPGNPSVGELADGKGAGWLIAKQHGKARL